MHFGIIDIYLVLALIVAGIIAGYSGGLFGIGGGAVLVPVFLTIFPFVGTAHAAVMHIAVGTSLALLVPNTLVAFLKQYKMGNIDFNLLKRWLPFVVVGATIGASVVEFIPTVYLKVIFATYLYASFMFIALKKEVAKEFEGKPHGYSIGIAGILIGCFSVFLGMGGGTFTVPYTQLHNYPMRKAIALSSATGVFIGIIGTIGVIISGLHVPGRAPHSLGFVNVIAFIIVLPFIIFFSPYGVRTANRLKRKNLKRMYAAFLLIVAFYMTAQIFIKY
ncbi:sulfite exporter TauE/SafE family protein [Candidiatus Paracoxiella cheracis]|uniref:sulfite exporter TauE/SafE family protein n=1 Tax=Candidiatus Paracoxiella cheracis TaxID=3405120 RepID=UPI003BF45E60